MAHVGVAAPGQRAGQAIQHAAHILLLQPGGTGRAEVYSKRQQLRGAMVGRRRRARVLAPCCPPPPATGSCARSSSAWCLHAAGWAQGGRVRGRDTQRACPPAAGASYTHEPAPVMPAVPWAVRAGTPIARRANKLTDRADRAQLRAGEYSKHRGVVLGCWARPRRQPCAARLARRCSDGPARWRRRRGGASGLSDCDWTRPLMGFATTAQYIQEAC